MHPDVTANIAANIEAQFYDLAEYDVGHEFSVSFNLPGEQKQTHNLKVINVMELETTDTLRENGQTVTVGGPKAIALKDDAGNVYVHFNGTGDGKWGYNTQAYDGQSSLVQKQSLDFFDRIMCSEAKQGGVGNVYVSGHSQGGNTAQYVTINSSYGDYIDTCISMDGPGFSEGLIDQAINQFGEAYFDRQTDKIYAYNGESDFVSPLGQVHIIPDGHTTVVATPIFEQEHNFAMAHDIRGMLTNGSLNLPPEGEVYHDTPFRAFIVSFAAEVKTLPQDQQAEAATLAMKFAEYYLGNGHTGGNLQSILTQKDLDDFSEILVPLLSTYLEKHPNMLAPALEYLGFSSETASLLDAFIKNFNDLPEVQRKAALEALLGCLVVNEDGSIGFEAGLMSIITALGALLPTLLETADTDPAAIFSVLKEYGVLDMITNYIKEHPLISFVVTALVIVFLEPILVLVGEVIRLLYAIEAFISFIEKLSDLAQEFKDFIVNALESIKEAIEKIKEFLRKNSPGGKYVRDNPYFYADPAAMRGYANRLKSINSRLVNLDRDLNDLYWQVGFTDLWKILESNILISYSLRVVSSQTYLNRAADLLESADNTALQYLGG